MALASQQAVQAALIQRTVAPASVSSLAHVSNVGNWAIFVEHVLFCRVQLGFQSDDITTL